MLVEPIAFIRAIDMLDHLPRLGNRARADGEAEAGRPLRDFHRAIAEVPPTDRKEPRIAAFPPGSRRIDRAAPLTLRKYNGARKQSLTQAQRAATDLAGRYYDVATHAFGLEIRSTLPRAHARDCARSPCCRNRTCGAPHFRTNRSRQSSVDRHCRRRPSRAQHDRNLVRRHRQRAEFRRVDRQLVQREPEALRRLRLERDLRPLDGDVCLRLAQ